MPTPTEIVEIAKVCQYLNANDRSTGVLFGKKVVANLDKILYMERKAVSWKNTYDPSNTTDLVSSSLYLSSLCRNSGTASYIINNGSGGSITPISPSIPTGGVEWVVVRSAQFSNATDYVNTDYLTVNFRLFGNWIARYLEPGTEWDYLPGGGFRILIAGFDSGTFDYEIYLDPQSATVATDTVGVEYSLSAVTVISALTGGTAFLIRTVNIYPNGYAYTWDPSFVFSDTWPEQAAAIDVNTFQSYTFQYSSTLAKWVCINQSINVPS